jgi:hypothetical protein
MNTKNTNEKPPHFSVGATIHRQILSPESRLRIASVPNWRDYDGLWGQFPELSKVSESWKREMDDLFDRATRVLTSLSRSKEFRGYFGKPSRIDMGWKFDEVLKNFKTPPMGHHLWSINLGDNHNLGLVFTSTNQLVVVTDQYCHQGDHNADFHWLLRHDDKLGHHHALKMDSHRLRMILMVLSNRKNTEKYLRAKLFVHETFRD